MKQDDGDTRFAAYLARVEKLIAAGAIDDDDPFPPDGDDDRRQASEGTQEERDKLPAEDFAGPHRSYPIRNQQDVHDAARLIGHADDPAAVKRRIIAIAHRKGFALPESWQSESTTASEGDPLHFDGQPDAGDVHAVTTMGGQGDNPNKAAIRKPNRMLRRLLTGLRGHFADHPAIDSEGFETHVRQAMAHAGGMARAEKRREAQAISVAYAEDDGDGHEPCQACKDGKPQDCQCDGCKAGQACDCCHRMHRHQQHTEGSPHVTVDDTAFRLFLPVSCAEAPAWTPFLPRPGTFTHPKYGKIALTVERNRDFVQKFNAGVYQKHVPLDAEHQTKLSGAMGWVQELRLNDDGSADARVEWTDRGRTLMSDNRFKYISPEWFDEWSDPATGKGIKNVVIGGALTTRPFFKESALRPLVASEAGIYVPDEDQEPVPACRAGEQHESPTGQEISMSAETTSTQFTEEQTRIFAERLAELEAENGALRQANEQAATEARQAAEAVAAMQTERRRQQFAEQARDWYGPIEGHVSFMESLTDEQREFYATQQRALAEQLKDSKLFTQMGRTGGASDANDPEARLEAEARSIQASEKLSYHQAYAQALERNPQLYAEIAGR